MKNVIITLLVFTAISFALGTSSCCKDKGPVVTDTTAIDPCTFKTKTTNYTFIFKDTGNISGDVLAFANFVPGGTALDSVSGSTVQSTVTSDLAAQNVKSCQVRDISAENLRVSIDSPIGYNFDVLDSVWLYIIKKDGSAKAVVGTKGSIPAGTKEIIMNLVPGFNVAPYVLQDSFKFQLGSRRSAYAVNYANGAMKMSFDAKFVGVAYTQ
jgi:hypothetical protein